MKNGARAKTAVSERATPLAIYYRLHIHPELWRGIRQYLGAELSPAGHEPTIFPECEFLSLTIMRRRRQGLADFASARPAGFVHSVNPN